MDFWFFLKIFWRGSPTYPRQLYFLTIKFISSSSILPHSPQSSSLLIPSSSHPNLTLILIPLHPPIHSFSISTYPPNPTHINLYKVLITPIILHIFTLLSTQPPYFISIFLSQSSISPLPQLI